MCTSSAAAHGVEHTHPSREGYTVRVPVHHWRTARTRTVRRSLACDTSGAHGHQPSRHAKPYNGSRIPTECTQAREQ
jgi:hypothetical protein